jgi:hypothetical protein
MGMLEDHHSSRKSISNNNRKMAHTSSLDEGSIEWCDNEFALVKLALDCGGLK